MPKIYDFWRDKLNLPTIVLVIAIIIAVVHLFSYLIPITDDAFVILNSQPVAADVSGYITKIYIKNGQKVKKGDPLFAVFAVPYQLAYVKAQANYEEAKVTIDMVQLEKEKNQENLRSAISNLEKAKYEYSLKSKKRVSRSISTLDVKKLAYDVQGLTGQVNALKKQVLLNQKQILQQQKTMRALQADMQNAKVTMDLTIVRAGVDGVVDNMYLAVGTPIVEHQPLFSLLDTNDWYVQANFEETDLRYTHPGNKVIVIIRMYYFNKIFHGVITNHLWVANRQIVDEKTQQQIVNADNEWLNLPQRLPLQIKILDPDPKYPLYPGASAYVYIQH